MNVEKLMAICIELNETINKLNPNFMGVFLSYD